MTDYYIHLDFETFSGTDISAGIYNYTQDPEFEIFMYAIKVVTPAGETSTEVFDCSNDEFLDVRLVQLLDDEKYTICAHNAAFERECLAAYGIHIPPRRWLCTMALAYSCALPGSLGKVAEALDLGIQKMTEGARLINFFSKYQNPTKTKPKPYRNTRETHPEKWAQFLEYCKVDVDTEFELHYALQNYELDSDEQSHYCIDQTVNSTGVHLDQDLAVACVEAKDFYSEKLSQELKDLTGLDSPNSQKQLRNWINAKFDGAHVMKGIAKEEIAAAVPKASGDLKRVLQLRQQSAKTSTAKYVAAMNFVTPDGRLKGLFQYHGAGTGRYAGRGVQIHNMPRNKMTHLDFARRLVKARRFQDIELIFGNPMDVLSQLSRTMFVASPGNLLAIGDWSAIEAVLVAWLCEEKWRLDVFNGHGKIYEQSASMMFGIPLDEITDELRSRGKVAELALGYGGSMGAMKNMGAEKMGLSDTEIMTVVKKWRKASPSIPAMWRELEMNAIAAVQSPGRKMFAAKKKVFFVFTGEFLQIGLPSGRKLKYYDPKIGQGKFGGQALTYMSQNDKGQWVRTDTYGGKILENIIQAIAADQLKERMRDLVLAKKKVVLHVHDEIGLDVPAHDAEHEVEELKRFMEVRPVWGRDIPFRAACFISPYYKKE